MIETGRLKMLFFPNDCKFCAIKEIYKKTSTAAVDLQHLKVEDAD